MTYRQIVAALHHAGIESAEWDAQLLVEHFCHQPREKLLLEPDRDFPFKELELAVQKRCTRFPLQYLLGEWQFYRQTYRVTPACLIPRQDTELLVEQAIRLLPPNAFFADLCTGTGCIAISVLCERPDTTALAVDISDEALQIATENAAKNGVSNRLTLQKANLLESFSGIGIMNFPQTVAILSNPPYIPSGNLDSLSPEVHSEPQLALDGGKDGLDFYRQLFAFATAWLVPNGFCLFEIGFDQRESIRQLAGQHSFTCQILQDLSGNDRVAELYKQN